MKINKLNYENYVIDYIEGTLSIELKKDFDLFLEKNEEVYEEIKDYISAPIFEESDEIFTNKKSIVKRATFNPYLLLAIIPLLLVATYFLIPSNDEVSKKEIEINTQEVIHQFAQEEKAVIEQERPIESIITQEKKAVTPPIKKQSKRKTNKQRTTKNKEVLFATNSSANKKIDEITKPLRPIKKASIELQSPALINDIAALDALTLNTIKASSTQDIGQPTLANISPRNERSQEDQQQEKNSWLEMITPASFNDIDLKESLAIESNTNINTRRKILNAFIPESLVK